MNLESLNRTLKSRYGIEATSVTEVGGGLDAEAIALRIEDEAGAEYFVKVRPSGGPGGKFAAFLEEHGVPAVRGPIRNDLGEVETESEGKAIFVYPFIDGANGFVRKLSLSHWRQLGAALREVHTVQPEGDLPQETWTVEGVDRFRRGYGFADA